MTAPHDVVVFFDCDNTLLDNDLVQQDLRAHLAREFGPASRDRYWAILEQLRTEVGYVDYLGALQRYRVEVESDPQLLLMSSYLVDYPFANRLYPGALDAIRHLGTRGLTVILSDGDVVFQPRKIQRSGLWDAWRKYLRKDVEVPYTQTLKYFEESGGSVVPGISAYPPPS